MDAIFAFMRENFSWVSFVTGLLGLTAGYLINYGRRLERSSFFTEKLKDANAKLQEAIRENTDLQARYDGAKVMLASNAEELDRLRQLDCYREWLFFVHDPAPRMPICPLCHADGRNMRLTLQPADLALPNYIKTLKCFKCDFYMNIDLSRLDGDPFTEKLGWESLVYKTE